MNKSNSNLLDDYEVIGLIVGFVIAIGFLSLPGGVAKEAKQDGWISILVGAIYPLVESLLCIYYCKKHPNEDILILSKKFLGKKIGTVCNLLFLVQSIFFIATMCSGLLNIFSVFATFSRLTLPIPPIPTPAMLSLSLGARCPRPETA